MGPALVAWQFRLTSWSTTAWRGVTVLSSVIGLVRLENRPTDVVPQSEDVTKRRQRPVGLLPLP